MKEYITKYSVYVVDDSEILRQNLKKLIVGNPKCVYSGESASLADGLMNIENLKPDFIILDINFPEGIGIDFIKKMKQASRKSKIIMFSNFDTEKLRRICEEEGADNYFNKSTEIEKLIEFFEDL